MVQRGETPCGLGAKVPQCPRFTSGQGPWLHVIPYLSLSLSLPSVSVISPLYATLYMHKMLKKGTKIRSF